MSWTLLVALVVGLGFAVALVAHARSELARNDARLAERSEARERGSHRARLQYPQVDLTRCLGCGTCVRACPEEGVLELIHGQAMVVHGARCVGHGRCAAECPTGAIAVALGDLAERRDIPALSERFEVPTVPGLFLAGELTGYALVRTAIAHGTAVADEVARRSGRANGGGARSGGEVLDLCIVGAGPAGLACSLQAKARGLCFVTLEQERLGGTVASYPRQKLVMTQPVDLPLFGRLKKTSYSKEELMELWERIAREHELPIRTGERFLGVEPAEGGLLRVRTESGELLARHVCLALGRRGTPRKLDVPGEELPKVAYSLLDAQSYRDRRLLVVGGGDSAVEAALGLAEQPGNEVALSYRRHAFFRLKARNEARLEQALAAGRLQVLYRSQVVRISPEAVELAVEDEGGERPVTLANDDVFVLAGGIPPFEVLQRSGVSFDPADRPPQAPLAERGTGLLPALCVALALALLALGWVALHGDYYALPLAERLASPLHARLRSSGTVGLPLGIAAAALVCANLAYLLRRSARVPLRVGSLRVWMTSHLVTGILALLLALLHGAMAPRDSVGGHALAALAVLVATGAIGRYFYSYVPHAANGRELALDEVQARLAALSAEWDQTHRGFGERVRREVEELVSAGRWRRSFVRRVASLLRARAAGRGALARLRREGRAEGLSADQLEAVLAIARRAHRTALMAAHYEDLRALLSTWRWVHRWVALLMVLLVAAHVAVALRYGGLFAGGGS